MDFILNLQELKQRCEQPVPEVRTTCPKIANKQNYEQTGAPKQLCGVKIYPDKLPCALLSGIVSCDAAAIRIRIRIVRCQRPAKRQKHKRCETQAHFSSPLLLVGSKELVLKVPKGGQFHAAIRVTRKRCDSCAHVALGTRTVSRRNS